MKSRKSIIESQFFKCDDSAMLNSLSRLGRPWCAVPGHPKQRSVTRRWGRMEANDEFPRCCLQGHRAPESVCGFADERLRQKRVVRGRRLLFVEGGPANGVGSVGAGIMRGGSTGPGWRSDLVRGIARALLTVVRFLSVDHRVPGGCDDD